MKKYRSLWYMSTTNHNILYFHCDHGIRFINNGNRLWKAWMRQEQSGVGRPILPEMLCGLRSEPIYALIQKPIPQSRRGQGAEMVQLGRPPVRVVDKRDQSSARLGTVCLPGGRVDFQSLN
jgi:hypothetical protein